MALTLEWTWAMETLESCERCWHNKADWYCITTQKYHCTKCKDHLARRD